MRVSINSIKKLTEVKIPVDKLEDLFDRTIGEVEEVIDLGKRYKKVLIAEIKEVKDHPDADKLNIYQVDIGESEQVQVVAGDKSLEVGDKVAYFPPNTKVPYNPHPEKYDGIVKKVKLRGVESNGMLASAKELDISNNHLEVMRLNDEKGQNAKPGELFAEVYGLNDTVFDIENKALTNRPECFGLIGMAREIAGIQGIEFKTPDWFKYWKEGDYKPLIDLTTEGVEEIKVRVKNEVPELCPRYMAIALDNIEVKKSPVWLQIELMKSGMRAVNNIVDITNYVMLMTGQPLHAFDMDKILERDATPEDDVPEILVRTARKGEKITVIDGKTHTLDKDIVVITDGVSPIAIGGVMGGVDTEVDENTKRIILESASFDLYSIRRTSMKTGIVSDAVVRYSRNQDPEQCEPAMLKAVDMMRSLASAEIKSESYDSYPNPRESRTIEIQLGHVNKRIGKEFTAEEVKEILDNVELYTEIDGERLKIQIPTYRQDLNIKEDIYEEIARLYGFDNIPLESPTRLVKTVSQNKHIQLKNRVREMLASYNCYEILTYNFIGIELYEKANLDRVLKKYGYRLKNALSPELEYMRTCITPSLLDKVRDNQNSGYGEFGLFEFNKYHLKTVMDSKEEKLPYEFKSLAMVYNANDIISSKKYDGSPYYIVKKYLDELLETLNSKEVQYEHVDKRKYKEDLPLWLKNMVWMYQKGAYGVITYEMERKKYYLGIIGEFCPHAKSKFKLPEYSAGFELNIESLQNIVDYQENSMKISKYPKVMQDLCFVLDEDVPYSVVIEGMEEILRDNDLIWEIEPVDIYKGDNDSEKKQMTVRLTLQHEDKVLDQKDIEYWRKKVTRNVRQKCGGKLKKLS